MNRQQSRRHVFVWMQRETVYASNKFKGQRDSHDESLRKEQISDDAWWYRQIHQYIDRARLQGLDTPQGRQQLAKALMTMRGCVESSVRVFGPLPEPGVPSGEIREWVDCP